MELDWGEVIRLMQAVAFDRRICLLTARPPQLLFDRPDRRICFLTAPTVAVAS